MKYKYILIGLMGMILAACCGGSDVVCKGTIQRVEYTAGAFLEPARTILFFMDGTTCSLMGSRDIKCKNVEVYHRGVCGRRRIKCVE